MRFSSSVTSVSWIPSEAVTGVALKMPFEVGLAHYDPPPPDSIDDLAAFLAADRCRFANRLSAWIEVQDGVIVEHGLSGQGYIGSTTLRLAGRDLTFAAVPLPDRTRTQPLGEDSVRFEQTGGGRTALPAPHRAGSAIRHSCSWQPHWPGRRSPSPCTPTARRRRSWWAPARSRGTGSTTRTATCSARRR